MKLYEIIYENECNMTQKDKMREIKSITVMPEEITDDTLLFIMNEKQLYGFLGAIKQPSVVVLDENLKFEHKFFGRSVSVLKCNDIRALLANAFSRFCQIDYSSFMLIGITGTNGKSSTATFVSRILSDAGYTVGFIGTGKIDCCGRSLVGQSYSMTTPDPWILYPALKEMEHAGCNAVVMEVSSHALALKKTAPLVFDYAVFTNLSAEHMDFHRSMEDYFLSKQYLLRQSNAAVINIDDHYGRRLYKEFSGKKKSVGILWKGDTWATHIQNHGFDGTEYMYREHDFIFKMTLKTPGIHNIYNSLLASALCIDIGIKPCKVKNSLLGVCALPGRFEIIKSDITVIIDYAHTSVAFETLLKEICSAKLPAEELTVIFGCGGERDREKRPKMASIAESFSNYTVVTSDNSRGEPTEAIIDDIVAGFNHNSYKIIPDRRAAIEQTVAEAKDGSIIAVIGKGAEKYNIDAEGYHDFDEKAIILEALELRRKRVRT